MTDQPISKSISPKIKEIIDRAYRANHRDVDHTEVTFTDPVRGLFVVLSNTVESEHFFIQHFRIPAMENYVLSEKKYAQIAYNAGQFLADRENGKYSQEIMDYYDLLCLGEWQTFFIDN